MHQIDLRDFETRTGRVEPVWHLEIQAAREEVDRIINKVMEVNPLTYGRYDRNAFVSAIGHETYVPQANSTSAVHLGALNTVQTFPSVLIILSIQKDPETLAQVLDAIRDVHRYEEPLIFVKEAWASRANYDPQNENPNRWWNRAGASSGD